jgi:hypothetical protein
MPIIFETKLGHKIEHTGTGTEERGYSYAASDKEITVFNNKTGAVRWDRQVQGPHPQAEQGGRTLPVLGKQRALPLRSQNGQGPDRLLGTWQTATCYGARTSTRTSPMRTWCTSRNWDGFAITLKDKLVWVLARTGEERWSTDKFKGVVGQYVVTKDSKLVMVNFMPTNLAALFSGFKNQIAKIDLTNGNILWESTYVGRAERKAVTRDFLYELDVKDDKVFLRMNGMQVYDLNTGASIYSAAFDFTPDKLVGEPLRGQAFRACTAPLPHPVIVGDDLYVLDMSSRKSPVREEVRPQQRKTAVDQPRDQGSARHPEHVRGRRQSAAADRWQRGGTSLHPQAGSAQTDGSYETTEEWRVWHPNVKPNGIQAFNTSDGSLGVGQRAFPQRHHERRYGGR